MSRVEAIKTQMALFCSGTLARLSVCRYVRGQLFLQMSLQCPLGSRGNLVSPCLMMQAGGLDGRFRRHVLLARAGLDGLLDVTAWVIASYLCLVMGVIASDISCT